MGRIVDLCGEIAAAAEEGAEGLELSPDVWDRLRADWEDEDIEDALSLVHDSLLQAALLHTGGHSGRPGGRGHLQRAREGHPAADRGHRPAAHPARGAAGRDPGGLPRGLV